jgi:AraC family transcriptional regulator, positive regulator of tynA and feaB
LTEAGDDLVLLLEERLAEDLYSSKLLTDVSIGTAPGGRYLSGRTDLQAIRGHTVKGPMQIDSYAADRTEATSLLEWEQVFGSTQQGVEAHLLDDMPFRGRLLSGKLGAVMIRRFRSTPMRYLRTPRLIDQTPWDMFGVTLTLSGRSVIRQGLKEIVQRPGDIVLLDSARAFEYILPEGDNQIVLDIPHVLLRERLPNVDMFNCDVLRGETTFGRLLGNMLRGIRFSDLDRGDFVSSRIGSAVVDMLATAFDTELAENISPLRATALEKVKKSMIERMQDPELDVGTIARENHLSTRSLYRLFAENETTAMRWLWQQRLRASYETLTSGRVSTVSEVALMHGFTNFSHFSRSFKQAFGILPNDVLGAR